MDCLVGIDIGGTNIKIGIIRTGDQFAVLKKISIPTNATDPADKMVQRIAEATKKLLTETGQKALGVGVGCPGLIDPKSGMVKKSPNLPNLPHFRLRDRLQTLLGLDVEIQNDANAAALGEFLFGPSKGINNLILLTLGTGVGGGVVADGHLLQGADNAAAELGHVKVEFTNGHPCACGKAGCLEAYAGAAGIARIAQEQMQKKSGYLGSSHFDTHALADAAKAGDAAAQKTFFIVGQYLGRAIANFIDTFNPEKVVIGGGASATMELLRPGIMQAVDEYASFPETLSRVQIERSAFPDDINVIGAAATWLNAHRIPVPHSK
ncbi:MAG TPA: ROK family protein [Tepidisphaeraceae bacterium]|jgi:glucokinase|nr:ROK family protein [Tepidisphaeraceae bacterium]